MTVNKQNNYISTNSSISPSSLAFFSHPDLNVNVIAVDWYPLATWDNYLRAAHNAVRVGNYCGEVIGVDILLNGLGQSPDQIHAIGHSLGGQLVGHFGRQFKEVGGQGPIARISCKYLSIFCYFTIIDLVIGDYLSMGNL